MTIASRAQASFIASFIACACASQPGRPRLDASISTNDGTAARSSIPCRGPGDARAALESSADSRLQDASRQSVSPDAMPESSVGWSCATATGPTDRPMRDLGACYIPVHCPGDCDCLKGDVCGKSCWHEQGGELHVETFCKVGGLRPDAGLDAGADAADGSG
jgi:hypothetical protein